MIINEKGIGCESCHFPGLDGVFTPKDIAFINVNKSEISFNAGEVIVRQGTYVSQIAFVKKGVVKKVLEGKNNKNTILKLTSENNFIALPILGNSDIYPFSIVALTDCDIWFIRKETMVQIVESNARVNEYLLKWYSEDYLYMYSKIIVMSTRNSHGKLASALIYLSNLNNGDTILGTISRKDLAEIATISLESTNKILMQLKLDRIIDINSQGISIIRKDLVEKLSTVG
ncbi:MAG: Crp/Fnr family transcriptional regulator [Bacteroidales bacterium]|nr:Crp/Fnr family transcriptional regulator [Bacteroidales bacterium]MBN2817357.1 Crp/Fnr family transcriptional regulator [Bacteroidales bacterium]